MATFNEFLSDPRLTSQPIENQLQEVDRFTMLSLGDQLQDPAAMERAVTETNLAKQRLIDGHFDRIRQDDPDAFAELPENATPGQKRGIKVLMTDDNKLHVVPLSSDEDVRPIDDQKSDLLKRFQHDPAFTGIEDPLTGEGDILQYRRRPSIDPESRVFDIMIPGAGKSEFEFTGEVDDDDSFKKQFGAAVRDLAGRSDLTPDQTASLTAVVGNADGEEDGVFVSAASDILNAAGSAVGRFGAGIGSLTSFDTLAETGERLLARSTPISTDSTLRKVFQAGATEGFSLLGAAKATNRLSGAARINTLAAAQTLPHSGLIFKESFEHFLDEGQDTGQARANAVIEATARSASMFAFERLLGRTIFSDGGVFNRAAAALIKPSSFGKFTPAVQKSMAGLMTEASTESVQSMADLAIQDISRDTDKFDEELTNIAAVLVDGAPLDKSETLFSGVVGGVVGGAAGGVVGISGGQEQRIQEVVDRMKSRIRKQAVPGTLTPAAQEITTGNPVEVTDEVSGDQVIQTQQEAFVDDDGSIIPQDESFTEAEPDSIQDDLDISISEALAQPVIGRPDPLDPESPPPTTIQTEPGKDVSADNEQIISDTPGTLWPRPGGKQNFGPGAAAKAEWRERAVATRWSRDGRIDQDIRDELGGDLYVPLSNSMSIRQAREAIDNNGPVQSAADVMDFTNGLEPAQRVTLADVALDRLDRAVKFAKRNGLENDAEQLTDLAQDMALAISDFGTQLGQGIQAFTTWNKLRPQDLARVIEKQLTVTDRKGRRIPPDLTEEQRGRIEQLAEEAQAEPEGFRRNIAYARINAEVANMVGSHKILDTALSYWYANILSGLNTQGVNIVGNAVHLLGRGVAASVADPKLGTQFWRGVLSAVPRAASEARSAFTTGVGRSKIQLDFQKFDALESLNLRGRAQGGVRGAAKQVFSLGRFVFRALQAGDTFFFRLATEGRAQLTAARAAKRKQQLGDPRKLKDIIAEDLGYDAQAWSDSVAQARAELQGRPGVTETDVARRAGEITDGNRPPDLQEQAEAFGELATYTKTPDGTIGAIAGPVNQIANFGISTRFGDIKPVKPFIPFVNIVANVTSAALDFTPIGAARVLRQSGSISGLSDNKTRNERQEQFVASVLGSGAMALVWGLANNFLEDDDPDIAIYGEGPKNLDQRRQLRSIGWKPFTIKIGNTFVRYNETPVAVAFAFAGGIMDRQRWDKKFDETETLKNSMAAMPLIAKSVADTGFMSSVKDAVEILTGDKDPQQFGARAISGLIPASSLLSDVAKVTDPEVVDARNADFMGNVIKNTPWAQRVNKPMINALGDPVEIDPLSRTPIASRFFSMQTDDPDWSYLGVNGLTIPGIASDVSVTSASGADKDIINLLELNLQERIKEYGRIRAGFMTDEERYEYVRQSGIETRKIVQKFRKLAPTPTDDQRGIIQEQMNQQIEAARGSVKLRILGFQ